MSRAPAVAVARVLTKPRRFETWEAAFWFAEFRSILTKTRQSVQLVPGPIGLPLWTVYTIREGISA